jgi:TolB-like protein/class 3 adenylate cyclase
VSSGDVERRLAAILSADAVGYSRLMARDEVATVRTLTAYRDQMEVLVRQHRGRIVDSPGDNVLSEFPSATDALQCAGEIQRVIQARNAPLPPEQRMEFRIGVHLGEVMVDGERIYGDGVNIAARLERLAEPGGICISGTVHDQVETKVRLRYEDIGDQEVKNITRPVHVYRARWETVATQETAAAPRAPAPSWVARVAAAVAVVVAVAPLVWLYYSWSLPTALSEGPSLAVLPFSNLSGDPEQEYFSDGLTEDLITDLSRIAGLSVIARNSTFTYKGRAVRVEEVGRELGVSHVLEGSVRRSGDRVRINAQLVDATSGSHLWAERYDRSLDDIFDLQDDVALSIVAALRVRLTDVEAQRLDRPLTENLEAYDLYLQGLALSQQMGREGRLEAKSLLERAIELDPEFGPAYAALAAVWVGAWLGHWTRDEGTPERAAALADRSLELDDSHVPSLVWAVNAYDLVGRNEDALATAQRAVALGPGSAGAHMVLARTLRSAGREREAEREFQEALRLNPLDPLVCLFVGTALFLSQDYDRALAVLRRGASATPEFIGLHGLLAVTYAEIPSSPSRSWPAGTSRGWIRSPPSVSSPLHAKRASPSGAPSRSATTPSPRSSALAVPLAGALSDLLQQCVEIARLQIVAVGLGVRP